MKNQINSKEEFNALARKIRLEKVDRKEILKLKHETILNERQKNKKMKNIIMIQRVFRGHKFRKSFQSVIDDLNERTITEYLLEKHKARIHKNATAIISYYLEEYIHRKHIKKEKYLNAFFNYCADVIISSYLSFKIRKKLKPIRDLLKGKKAIISKHVMSYRTRLILRSSSLQNALVEIANIKYCLNSMKTEDKLREDFESRLPKLMSGFYNSFYNMKRNGTWIDAAKSELHWLTKYMSLIYKDNPKYKTAATKLGSKTKSIKSFGALTTSGNLQEDYDEKPIRPMRKNIEDGIEEGNEYNSEKKPDINEQNQVSNTNPYEDYENKVIKVKKIDYEHMFDDMPISGDGAQDQGSSGKKKVIKKNAPKKPKYDARKAIEEAKKKEAEGGGHKEKKSSFREFLREMKNNAKGIPSTPALAETVTPPEETKTAEEPRRNRRKEPVEISMRKKLHELERSPPPRLNLHNVKSKVECWGTNNNDNNNLKSNYNSNGNLNIKKIKKTEDESMNLTHIEKIYTKLTNKYNINSAMKEKEDMMKSNYKRIPYIKKDSSCISKFNYTNEEYTKMIGEILAKYDEMKNQN